MVTVKRALTARAQEALELIAGATVFHTIRDNSDIHLHAEYGNATLSLILPLAHWSEISPLVEWVEDLETFEGRRLMVKTGTTVSLFENLPIPSNDPSDDAADSHQLDLPLPELNDYAILEAAGQQTLDLA